MIKFKNDTGYVNSKRTRNSTQEKTVNYLLQIKNFVEDNFVIYYAENTRCVRNLFYQGDSVSKSLLKKIQCSGRPCPESQKVAAEKYIHQTLKLLIS